MASDRSSIDLTLEGWRRVLEIQKNGPANNKRAFMAMPFGDSWLDEIYRARIVAAVSDTGFDLKGVDEEPRAGLIDSRIRVDIRNSRFLLAELTGNNNGVYWEAGFADGLGKPVIYLCEQDPDGKLKTHFDTNHHQTVGWRGDDLDKAMEELKAVIRATLPAEAKMVDTNREGH
jgi:hypothetical protein